MQWEWTAGRHPTAAPAAFAQNPPEEIEYHATDALAFDTAITTAWPAQATLSDDRPRLAGHVEDHRPVLAAIDAVRGRDGGDRERVGAGPGRSMPLS